MLLRAREYLNLVRRVLAAAALGEDFREVQTEPFELVIGPVLDPCPLRNFTRTSNEVDLAARTQENFPLRAKRIPPCAEGDDPLAIQLQQ